MVCPVTVGNPVKISFSAAAESLQLATLNEKRAPVTGARAREGQAEMKAVRFAALVMPDWFIAGTADKLLQLANMLFTVVTAAVEPGNGGIVCRLAQLANMFDIFPRAATDPGNGGIVCRLAQLENILSATVTAATDPGNGGIVCRLAQPSNMLDIIVTAVAEGRDGMD